MDNRAINVNPLIFQGRGFAAKEDHAFIIMPFGPRWSSLVWATIKDTMKTHGFKCTRADEQYGHQILEDIWCGICEASIVVADVTGRNPNVYYELGIAHVLGKRVVLLTQNGADIPFDTRVYRHIMYSVPFFAGRREKATAKLATDLGETVKWIKENELVSSGERFADAYAGLKAVRSRPPSADSNQEIGET